MFAIFLSICLRGRAGQQGGAESTVHGLGAVG